MFGKLYLSDLQLISETVGNLILLLHINLTKIWFSAQGEHLLKCCLLSKLAKPLIENASIHCLGFLKITKCKHIII